MDVGPSFGSAGCHGRGGRSASRGDQAVHGVMRTGVRNGAVKLVEFTSRLREGWPHPVFAEAAGTVVMDCEACGWVGHSVSPGCGVLDWE